ncbi:hypothetical protein ACJX0J_009532, partial [Zea mays]
TPNHYHILSAKLKSASDIAQDTFEGCQMGFPRILTQCHPHKEEGKSYLHPCDRQTMKFQIWPQQIQFESGGKQICCTKHEGLFEPINPPSLPPSFAHMQTPLPSPPRCAHARAPPPLTAAAPSPFLRRRRSPAAPSATVSFASTSATRDTPQFLLSLPNFLCPRSSAVLRAAAEVRHRRPGPSPRHCRHREVPGVRLE